jgi:short-subunit dehydrogenase
MKKHNIRDKLVLITGASSGIGAAIAIEAAKRGAIVALVGRDKEKLQDVQQTIAAADGRSYIYVTALANAESVESLRGRIEQDLGVPHFLINNAGSGRWAYLEDTSYAEIDQMIDAPLRASLYVTRAFLPGMLQRNSGAIGNVSSIAAFLPWSSATVYTAVRWAIRGLHEALRADLCGTNLSVTLAATAAVKTEYFNKNLSPVPVTPFWIPLLEPDQVAAAFIDALVNRRSILVIPKGIDLLRSLHYLLPSFVNTAMRTSAGQPRK